MRNLVDAVAKGGNFMFGIGPDANGQFPPGGDKAIEYAGAWLRVNGEAIYATRHARARLERGRRRPLHAQQGQPVGLRDRLQWPGAELKLATVRPAAGATVTMLGLEQPLTWTPEGDGVSIRLPEAFADPARRLGTTAWVFRIPTVR